MSIFSRIFGVKKPKKTGAVAARMAYDASRARRRLSGWNADKSGMKNIISAEGEQLRSRTRDLVRNNCYVASAQSSFVSNLIGDGIKPLSTIRDNKELKDQIKELWDDWAIDCDADGLQDFSGLQTLIGNALFDSGEIFFRFRTRRLTDGYVVPLQLQALESDMLDYAYNVQALEGQNAIVNGVEFDGKGMRVAYHFWRTHPGDNSPSVQQLMGERVRVPASQVLHIFKPVRAGQVRGVPIAAPAILRSWMLDQYDDAELDRKKIAALFAGFITSAEPDDDKFFQFDPEDPESAAYTSANPGIATLEPGTMQQLLPGETVTFSNPADVGGSYEMFQYRNLLAIFAALGVPYTLGSGDLKRANYSSLRGAMVEYRRRIRQIQNNVIIHQFCRVVRQRWLDEAVLSGALTIADYDTNWRAYQRTKWILPRFDWVDPLKDIQAEEVALRNKIKSRTSIIEESGGDMETTLMEIAEEEALAESLGVELKAPAPVAPGQQPGQDKPDNGDNQDDPDDNEEDNPDQTEAA